MNKLYHGIFSLTLKNEEVTRIN